VRTIWRSGHWGETWGLIDTFIDMTPAISAACARSVVANVETSNKACWIKYVDNCIFLDF